MLDYNNEFDSNNKKVINIKEKVENEINKINELYETMNKEIKNSFESKHEKLIKEEKEVKDKLDNEVTKIKTKLEEYLSLANSLIRNNDKISKGIQRLNNEEQNKSINILRSLAYISKINSVHLVKLCNQL